MSVREIQQDENEGVTIALLEAIGDAFNRHDVDAIVDFFAEDGVFVLPKGSDYDGGHIVGKVALHAFFSELMETLPDIQWHPIDNRIDGNKGISEWRRQATLPSGEKLDCLGLDIFTFKAGLVIKKDSYFKIIE
ncbi:MAG: nuclear transport factor 2 family protein [Rhodospirillaceae bacterium]|nr:nuclear transport factor 2 family protein [Rhodospirillaceae bacterium]